MEALLLAYGVEWRYPAVGIAILLAVAVLIAPKPPAPAAASADFARSAR